MTYTCAFTSNPIKSAVDGRSLKRLSLDVGDLPEDRWEMYLSGIRETFVAEKLGHIELRALPRPNPRRAILVMESRIYWIEVGLMPPNKAGMYLEKIKAFIQPVLDWCKQMCQGGYVMDERGMTFDLVDDYMLFKLKFTGYGK